ncbi:SPX-domain-containing protein, partial [Fistulina hepatica ATCC 64428]
FSSSLRFNALSEWVEEYIDYDDLKRYIYQLEKELHAQGSSYLSIPEHDLEAGVTEHTALVSSAANGLSRNDHSFVALLDPELRKVTAFYEQQAAELDAELDDLDNEVRAAEQQYQEHMHEFRDEDEDEDEDEDVDEGDHEGISGLRRTSVSSSEGDMEDSVAELPPRGSIASLPRRTSQSKDSSSRMRDGIVALCQELDGCLVHLKSVRRTCIVSAHLCLWLSERDETSLWHSRSNYAYDTRLLLKRRITAVYIHACNLRAYVEVNYTGFRKILKKYDKVVGSELKDHYLHTAVERATPFTPESRAALTSALERLTTLYAMCVTRGDRATARSQLRLHQREQIAWARDTVWRQMVGRARRGESDNGVGPLGAAVEIVRPVDEDNVLFQIGPLSIGPVGVTKNGMSALIAFVVFLLLLGSDIIGPSELGGYEANRCFAVLIFATILWATEAIPLFVTSLAVPFLLVFLQVIRDDDGASVGAVGATKYIFSVMFSPTIMLLIGGFTISSALSKTAIDRVLITRVLSFAGSRPHIVLLTFMGVSCFASMWISNVAAPTLCFTLIRLAIALAANIGGQSSPISSPQNLIALGDMEPPLDWGSWRSSNLAAFRFAVAIPVSTVSIILIWLILLASYRPARSPDGEGEIQIKTIRSTKEPFTATQYWVSFVCLLTIALWCIEHRIESVFGDMGVIALIPIVAFFATGVLKKEDFDQFAWTIVFLAMGGIVLGKGVTSSGLLTIMDTLIRRMVDGYSLYTVVLILSPVVLVISTLISHTIASVLLVPVAKEVGSNLPGDHQNLLIFITGLICSTGMGMPVSGFPNQTAATQEDELGQLYLSNVDFLKNGVPASVAAMLVVSTLGFVLMRAIGM